MSIALTRPGGGSPDLSSYPTGAGLASRVAIWNTATNISYDSNLYFDFIFSRFGILSTNPNYNLENAGTTKLSSTAFLASMVYMGTTNQVIYDSENQTFGVGALADMETILHVINNNREAQEIRADNYSGESVSITPAQIFARAAGGDDRRPSTIGGGVNTPIGSFIGSYFSTDWVNAGRLEFEGYIDHEERSGNFHLKALETATGNEEKYISGNGAGQYVDIHKSLNLKSVANTAADLPLLLLDNSSLGRVYSRVPDYRIFGSTLADDSDLALFLPYSGATGSLDMGVYNVTANTFYGDGSNLTGISSSDEKAKVSANDTTEGYLNGKLVAGDGITLTENNDGGNETLTISAMPKIIKLISDTGWASGSDIHLSGASWDTDKALIYELKLETSSTDWGLWLLQNDNGYAADDADIPARPIITNAKGDKSIYISIPYEDEDASQEIHLYWVDNNAATTLNKIIITGIKLS